MNLGDEAGLERRLESIGEERARLSSEGMMPGHAYGWASARLQELEAEQADIERQLGRPITSRAPRRSQLPGWALLGGAIIAACIGLGVAARLL